ncbi:MAG TPA: DUF4172 domain-containing protein [Chlamydiales bacterium]|nr:DUF4172 domain-containing protein [Chlamydiales bacterium]
MSWNWELPNWPQFNYDIHSLQELDQEFLLGAGGCFAFLKTIDEIDRKRFVVDILSIEGTESSRIEGETLDRKSLQSSIRKHFGLEAKQRTRHDKEFRMAELLCKTYETFDLPLTHEMLWEWHDILFENTTHLEDMGRYRTHPEPMQIVSNRYNLKNREFDKEAAQFFASGASDHCLWQGASEDKKTAAKPTSSKTDSSGCFGISAEKYISITKAPRATVTRDLADLVKKGALVKLGELRHTRYRLNITFNASSTCSIFAESSP